MTNLWNSTFKRKEGAKGLKRTPMKRGGRLRTTSNSEGAKTKKRIQALLREIVMVRDKSCILSGVRCGAILGHSGVVWQADHLVTRSNSATYGDSRFVVLICRDCHGWKSVGSNLRKAEYDRLVRQILPPERVKLWDMAELEAGKYKGVKMDWRLVELALENELAKLQSSV